MLTFYDDKYSNLIRLPFILHVQHAGKLQGQQKCFIKVVRASDLKRPDVDEAMASVVSVSAIVVKILKAMVVQDSHYHIYIISYMT